MLGTLLQRKLTGHSGAPVGALGALEANAAVEALGAVGAVEAVGADGGVEAVRAVAILKRKPTGHSVAAAGAGGALGAVGAVGASISFSSSSAFLAALWGDWNSYIRTSEVDYDYDDFQHNECFDCERKQQDLLLTWLLRWWRASSIILNTFAFFQVAL